MDRSQSTRFCEAIIAELEGVTRRYNVTPHTIFFGGGTPTALSSSQLEFLLTGFHRVWDLSKLRELTIEANPGSVSARKAALLRRLGINRISLGVQSWNDDLLQLLGREHNAAQAEQSFQLFRDAGFENISIDLMFGLPGQTLAQWRDTLHKTIALGPEHISAYCLTYEEDTDFFLRYRRGELSSDPDFEGELFDVAMAILESAGYEHYEISNYARPGFASLHNRAYWSGSDYLGIGPSAFSTVDLDRWQNVADYRAYADRVLAGSSPINSTEILTPEMKQMDRLALRLRTREGIPAGDLSNWPEQTADLIRLGLLSRSNGAFMLTRAGKCVADSVAETFL